MFLTLRDKGVALWNNDPRGRPSVLLTPGDEGAALCVLLTPGDGGEALSVLLTPGDEVVAPVYY